MQSPELKLKGKDRYICPECQRDFTWRWIRRHLVRSHGYEYWDNTIVYKPIPPTVRSRRNEQTR